MSAERELARRKKGQEWEAATANTDALLATLAGFEKMAKDVDRARSLRRFVDEIAASKAARAFRVHKTLLRFYLPGSHSGLHKATGNAKANSGENTSFVTLPAELCGAVFHQPTHLLLRKIIAANKESGTGQQLFIFTGRGVALRIEAQGCNVLPSDDALLPTQIVRSLVTVLLGKLCRNFAVGGVF